MTDSDKRIISQIMSTKNAEDIIEEIRTRK